MKSRIFMKIFVVFSLFLFSLTTFANNWFKIEEQTSNSVKLSWDKIWEVGYYQINYWNDKNSKSLETEAIDGTSYEIKDLNPWEDYYFSLVWLDSSWKEVYKSKDLKVSTKDSNFSTFALSSLELKEENILRLTFTKNLDLSKISESEFKINSSKDFSENIEIKNKKVVDSDPKSIDLELSWNIKDWLEYKVVVLAVFDEKWNNIKFWVDSEWKFIWWEVNKISEVEKEEELNSAWPVEEVKEVKKEWLKEVNSESKKSVSGREVSSENVWKNVNSMSESKEKLPQTWPEIFILFILALLIPGWIFILKNKKS